MKKSTTKIVSYFPLLEQYVNDDDSVILSDDVLSKLNETEHIFLRLAWFFENPEKETFHLEALYKQLDNDWLGFAIEVIYTFFEEDTYLLQHTTFSLITDHSVYLNQTEFAEYLTKQGLHFNRPKLHTYLKRGKIPKPDITVSGTPYWLLSTCEAYLEGADK